MRKPEDVVASEDDSAAPPALAPPVELTEAARAEPMVAAEIDRRVAEIDMSNAQSILLFGGGAQADLVALSDQMLEGVRNKDVGPAGDSLRDMVLTIRGFEIDALGERKRGGLWGRIAGLFASGADFQEQFTTVKAQIERITDELLGHETTLLKDIKALDRLYAKSLDYYGELALYIAAGEAKLATLDRETIPALAREAETAPESVAVLKAQELRDLRQARGDLERRVHDLKLTRAVTLQSLPSIRLVQENDKALVGKINTTVINTVPLWRTQLAQAIAMRNLRGAAADVRAAADLTNDLLRQNADALRQSNKEVRVELERGVVDMEALRHSHQQVIATIEDGLAVAEEGRRRRLTAEAEMRKLEIELKAKLASTRATGAGRGQLPGEGASV